MPHEFLSKAVFIGPGTTEDTVEQPRDHMNADLWQCVVGAKLAGSDSTADDFAGAMMAHKSECHTPIVCEI